MSQKNRWNLDDDKKEQIKSMIIAHISKIAKYELKADNDSRWDVSLDLSELPGVGPYHIENILKELGYENNNYDTNGWQMDYWFHFIHQDKKFPPLCLQGTAIIHEMYLHGEDDDYVTYAEREERFKNDPELQDLIKRGMAVIAETEKLLQEDNNE